MAPPSRALPLRSVSALPVCPPCADRRRRPTRSSNTSGGIAWMASLGKHLSARRIPIRHPLRTTTAFVRPHHASLIDAQPASGVHCCSTSATSAGFTYVMPWRQRAAAVRRRGLSVCSGAGLLLRLASSRSLRPVPTRLANCSPPGPGMPMSSDPTPLPRPPSPARCHHDDFCVPVLVLTYDAPARLDSASHASMITPSSQSLREHANAWAPSPLSSSGTVTGC